MLHRSQSGRSMIEMILVIAIIILLSVGALVGYRQIINRHHANSLYEDVLTEADSLRGRNYRGKTTYDSGIGNSTRQGLRMTTDKSQENTFSIIVGNVPVEVCFGLKNKDWKDALRVKINGIAYKTDAIDCSGLLLPWRLCFLQKKQELMNIDVLARNV